MKAKNINDIETHDLEYVSNSREYRKEHNLIPRKDLESLIKDRIKELEEEMKKHEKHFEVDDSYCPIKPDNCEYWYECDDPWYSYCYGEAVIKRAICELKRLLGEE